MVTDAAFSELRNGCYPGEKSFGEKILEALKNPFGVDRKKGSVGEARQGLMMKLRQNDSFRWRWRGGRAELMGRGKWKDKTELVAALVGKRTRMLNHRGGASRLGMGHEVAVTTAVRRFRNDRTLAEKLNTFEKKMKPPFAETAAWFLGANKDCPANFFG